MHHTFTNCVLSYCCHVCQGDIGPCGKLGAPGPPGERGSGGLKGLHGQPGPVGKEVDAFICRYNRDEFTLKDYRC